MLTKAPPDPRAWTAATIDDPRSWYYPLPDSCLSAFEQVRRDLRASPRPITSIQLPESQRSALAQSLRIVLEVLENGRGFAIVEAPRGLN